MDIPVPDALPSVVTTPRSRPTATGVWSLLMTATVLTTWLVIDSALDSTVATVVVVLIAGWKVRLVMRYFMELRLADWIPRLIMEVWVVGVTLMIVGFYLVALR